MKTRTDAEMQANFPPEPRPMKVKTTRLEQDILKRMQAGWEPFPMQLGTRLVRSLERKGLAFQTFDDKGRLILKLKPSEPR